MDRKEAARMWRDTTRGIPEVVVSSRTVHEFAQRVEAATLAVADRRLSDAKAELLRVARRAISPMAHAAERDPTYQQAYEELDAVIAQLRKA